MKFPLPQLLSQLTRRFLTASFFAVLFGIACYYTFFEDYPFSSFISIFLIGFLFCAVIGGFLLATILISLGRIFTRVKRINEKKSALPAETEIYRDNEPGEFYEFNKSLSRIHNYLRWQSRIISQEGSELEAVISALTGAILAVDRNKKVLFFNNQATALFFLHRQAHKKEVFLSEIIRNPDILQAYNECLHTGDVIKKTVSIGVFGADEENTVYEITTAPFKKTTGGVHGAVGLFYDISDIRKTEHIQMDFITNVSHELRTPLTAIQGYVETLFDETESGNTTQIKHFLNIIKRNVSRLVSLLNHFLDLAKMEDNKELKKERLDTEKITLSLINDMHIKKHKIKTNFEQKTVLADRYLLKQILYNLIDNAVKYVPPGRLIEALWTKENNFVILTVKDQGEGIAGRHKARLFERFYRVDPSRKKVEGAGIGLFIVKQLVEKHKGRITVESEPFKGSSFVCSFPDEAL